MLRSPIRVAIAASVTGALLTIASPPPTLAQPAAEVTKVQALSARRLSPLLPRRPLAQWLPKRLRSTGGAVWELNDCGEQTGGPADKGRDLPLCVEVWANLRGTIEAGLLIQVGTQSRRWSGRPRIRTRFVRARNIYHDFRTMRAWLEQIDLVIKTPR